MDRKQYQNDWKKRQRELNTPYAQRQRIAKRGESVLKQRRLNRQTPEQKEKERLYQIKYRQRPDVKLKAKARYTARWAFIKGIIKRPNNCDICNKPDAPLIDGRSGLRMDHYLGYEKENWLKVKYICVECDGKQLRHSYE